MPRTCESLNNACGTFSDGCRRTITCGCTAPATCGGGGTANVCGQMTVGTKRVLFIRVDFSDAPGEPVTVADATAGMNEIDQFYRTSSNNRMSIQTTVTPTVVRLTGLAADYRASGNWVSILSAGESAARNAGYDVDGFERFVVAFNLRSSQCAYAQLRNRGLYVDIGNCGGSQLAQTVAHELGHTFGLGHSNSWSVPYDSILGTSGSTLGYGNFYDVMTSATTALNLDFNASFKSYMNWFAADEQQTVTTSGTFRVSALEVATGALRALRLPRGNGQDLWVEYRQSPTFAPELTVNGVLINRTRSYNPPASGYVSELLAALKPYSGEFNAQNGGGPLLIGQTFSDVNAGIHITPLGRAGTSPEAMNLVVNRGSFAGNRAPVATLAGPTTLAAGASATFSATASDPDGDALSYLWRLFNGNHIPVAPGRINTIPANHFVTTNQPSVTVSSLDGYEQVVQVVASDMRGQVASRAMVVTSGARYAGYYRMTGRVTVAGQPLVNAVVTASTTANGWPLDSISTDSDGAFALVNMPPGTYYLRANRADDHAVVPLFANPVTVSADVAGLDFAATPRTFSIAGTVTSGGLPVAGATVTTGSAATTTTNSSGQYTLAGLGNGFYTVTATKSGITLAPVTTNPVEVLGASVSSIDFR